MLAACIMLSLHGFGQTQKGILMPGGNADASMSINGSTRGFNVSVQPTFAAFVVNNFAVGFVYSFGLSGSRVPVGDTAYKQTNTFTTSLGPYLKYYIGKKALKGAISASAAYLISSGVRTLTNRSPAQDYGGFSVGGTVAAAYFFNPHVSLEPGLYINTTGYQTQIPTTRFGFSLGLYVFIDKPKPARPADDKPHTE